MREELGECLLALGRPAEARPHFSRPHFSRAHELLSQDLWLREHEPERLTRLATLGLVEGATNNCNAADPLASYP